jgi:hypothetical protein
MSTAMPNPEGPVPDDVERGLAEVERYLADQAAPPQPAGDTGDAGETARVRALRAEVAEARALTELQGDEAPLLVDTPKARKRRKQAAEAARLHALAQNPASQAWQAARCRLVVTWVAVVALVLALGWSTAGVQVFAAEGAPVWSPGWCFAWFVEPFLSLALLTVVAARAFMATRGWPLEHPTLQRIEWRFLALTFGMNTWPHLPFVAHPFTLSRLVLHVLGPIVAVSVVTALPIIWRAFADLDHGGLPAGSYAGATGPTYKANTTAPATPGSPTSVLVARAQALIDAGRLPADPSATKLREALRCGMDAAREVRDALREGQA